MVLGLIYIYIYVYIYIYREREGVRTCGVAAKVLDCNTVDTEFEIQ